MPGKKVRSTNRANTATGPLDAESILVGQWVTVYDPIMKPPPDLIENLNLAEIESETVHLYLNPPEGIDSLKGKLFKVRSVMLPYVLCSLHSPQGDPISITPFDLRRVSLCRVSDHYRRKMRDLYDDIRGYQMARAGYSLAPDGSLVPPSPALPDLTSPLSSEERQILNLLEGGNVTTTPSERSPNDRPPPNSPESHPPT